MTYPSRGAWVFRNVTRGFDFTPTLESIGIDQEYPDMTASLGCRVVDLGDGWVFDVEDEVRVSWGGQRIFAGHLKTVTEDQDEEGGPRAWVLEGQDYTAKLEDALVRRRRKRKREKAKRRVRWLLRCLQRKGIWDLDGQDLTHIPDEYVEAYDYFGATVGEALSHIADELRLHFYIDLDNVFQMYRSDQVAAPFGLDNDAPDYASTFPFREYARSRDSVELANAILAEPEKRKHARWVKDSTSIVAYGRQERFVSDSNLHRAKQARNLGNRTLASTKDPQVDGSLVVWEPGIWGGMTVHVTEALWSRDEDVFVTAASLEAVDPHDADGVAYLKTTLSFDERRRRRGRGSRDSVNKLARHRKGVMDVDLHVLDDFGRVVSPPALVEGSVWGALGTYQASKGEDPDGNAIPFAVGSAAIKQASSYIGSWYKAWTTEPCGCPGLENCFMGWKDIERWYHATVPAVPGDMAGARLDIPTGQSWSGVGSLGARVVVRSSQPTDTWQGSVVGYLTGTQGGSVLVPGALIPAAGGTLHVGFQANWNCAYDSTACGWQWPFTTGAGNSGRYFPGSTPTLTWMTYDDTEQQMGAIAASAREPWEGGNDWYDGGSEGSPSWSVDGDALIVSSTTPAGKGWYLIGEREDDDQPWGPWSDCACSLEVTFTVDALGDTGQPGTRSIEVRLTGEGEQPVGTVHLGDGTRDPGISVGGPTVQVYDAVSLTAGDKWRAKFDSRSGKMRGKVWKVGDPEPAIWNVETPLEETEDDQDRLSLWVRVGNDGAGSQEVRIHRIRAAQGGWDGQKVDREYLGQAPGNANAFTTCHPYREGTLRVFVNGVGIAASQEDGDEAEFTLDFWPTRRSILRASYVIDQGEGDE
jgi:hypothetical protein